MAETKLQKSHFLRKKLVAELIYKFKLSIRIKKRNFGIQSSYDKVINRLNFEVQFDKRGGIMNVHVDIGRWSRKCPFLSMWGTWVV